MRRPTRPPCAGESARRRGRRRAGEGGFTLVELLVVTVMIGVVGAIALSAFTSGLDRLARADDDSRGQADITIAAERLSRDLRQGRGIAATSDATRLTIWIDTDADYFPDPTELVTWRAVTAPDSPGHFRLERAEGGSAGVPVGNTLVSDVAFAYDDPVPADARVVTVSMRYDAIVNAYVREKNVTFQIRLRNVE